MPEYPLVEVTVLPLERFRGEANPVLPALAPDHHLARPRVLDESLERDCELRRVVRWDQERGTRCLAGFSHDWDLRADKRNADALRLQEQIWVGVLADWVAVRQSEHVERAEKACQPHVTKPDRGV